MGPKKIELLDVKGRRFHNRYCYKKPESALRRAVNLSMSGSKFVQIWDNNQGRELALVSREYHKVIIHVR